MYSFKITAVVIFLFFILCFFTSCNSGSVNGSGSIFEVDFGDGFFPKISNCIGDENFVCVYFSDLDGNIRFAPFSMPNTSTYVFISSEGFAVPLVISSKVRVILQNLGLEYSSKVLFIEAGGKKFTRSVKDAVAVLSSGLTAISWYDENYEIYLLIVSDKLEREVRIPNFINNYIQQERKEEKLISTAEIKEKYGRCFDLSLYSERFVSISLFSENTSSLKFILYDVFRDSHDKDFVEGGFNEFLTKPEKLGIPDFYLIRLPERTFPSSEVAMLDPQVPFGFLDPQSVWIYSKEEVSSVRIRYPKLTYVFEDFCSLFWKGNVPGLFAIEKGKLKAFVRRSKWLWDESGTIDKNIWGGSLASFYSSLSPCVVYQKGKDIFYSCEKDGWMANRIKTELVCADIEAFSSADGRLYIACGGLDNRGKPLIKGFVVRMR